jgi:hypothetical protein
MSDQPITGRAGFPPAPELPEPWKAAHQTALHLLLALGWAAREAACRCGQRPADSVPADQYDVPAGKLQPTQYGVLGYLAELCIRSDPQGNTLDAALPYLTRSQSARSGPVRIAWATGKSVAEAVLRAARGIASTLRVAFGCCGFVEIVLASYPRDAESDPWDVNMALGWYETTRSSPEAADQIARSLARKTEFLSRLLCWPLREALDAVRPDDLCRWLHEQFGGLDVCWLREQLELEFVRAAEEFKPSPRWDVKPSPRWDGELRTLFLGTVGVKTYGRQPATRQIDLLEAFEQAGWARSIANPFQDHDTLNQTCKDLNKALPVGTLQFHLEGTGEGVYWEFNPAPQFSPSSP